MINRLFSPMLVRTSFSRIVYLNVVEDFIPIRSFKTFKLIRQHKYSSMQIILFTLERWIMSKYVNQYPSKICAGLVTIYNYNFSYVHWSNGSYYHTKWQISVRIIYCSLIFFYWVFNRSIKVKWFSWASSNLFLDIFSNRKEYLTWFKIVCGSNISCQQNFHFEYIVLNIRIYIFFTISSMFKLKMIILLFSVLSKCVSQREIWFSYCECYK